MSTACDDIKDLGWAFYFTKATMSRAETLGLDGFRMYFLGRGGVLGDVEAPIVVSAFGYFEPGLVASMWSSARKVLPARRGGEEYVACCQEFGRRRLSGVGGLEEFCAAAGAVNDEGRKRLAALTLYAGWSSMPLPDDPPARAMQLITVLRELRGSAHLAAVVALGLDPKTAHFIARPEMWGAFGYREGEQPVVTEEDAALLEQANALTDRQLSPIYGVLDHSGRRDLVAGLEGIKAALSETAPSAE